MKYHFFVDESGDQGLDKIRNANQGGATEFMTMGGVLVPDIYLAEYRLILSEIADHLGKEDLHCKDMNHLQKAYFARKVSELKILCFCVVSRKDTLGVYKQRILGSNQAQLYYNKCSQFLLERLGAFMKFNKIEPDQVSIKFEKINSYDYSRLRNFISQIRKTPKNESAKLIQKIEPFGIEALDKTEEKLLCLADLVAYSSYQMVNYSRSNYFIPDHRYFRELKCKFWNNQDTGVVANYGVKIIRGPHKLGLKKPEREFFAKLYKPTK